MENPCTILFLGNIPLGDCIPELMDRRARDYPGHAISARDCCASVATCRIRRPK